MAAQVDVVKSLVDKIARNEHECSHALYPPQGEA